MYIPPNRNGNQRRTATVVFATEREMKAAQSKLIMYNNFRVYWVNREKRDTRRRESFREERGRSWDRSSQISNAEENRSRRGEQKSKMRINERKNKRRPEDIDWTEEEKVDIQNQNIGNQTRYKSMEEKEEGLEKRIIEVKAEMQGKGIFVEDILGRILERLERLEKT